MTMYDRATLHIGQGTFEMVGDLTITEGVRTGYLVGGSGSSIWSWVQDLAGDDASKKQGIYLGAGGGAHTVEIEFTGWKGATDEDGNDLQWGDDPDPSVHTRTSATGQKALAQIQCLTHYMITVDTGSLNLGTLEFGERSEGGIYEPLGVVLEGPNMQHQAGNGARFSGTLTCISAADLGETIDSVVDVGW